MPILSLKYGSSNVNAVYVDDDGNVSSYFLGYGYSKDLYAHFISEQEFYTEIVEHIIGQLKVSREGLKVIATGFPNVPPIGQEYASSVTLDELFKKVDDFEVVSVSNGAVFTQNNYLSFHDGTRTKFGSMETNYLLNLSIYNNAFPTRPSDYNLVMSNIWGMLNNNRENTKELMLNSKPLVFFGDVFYKDLINQDFENIAYLYFISMVVNPGVFSLKIDDSNLLPHYLHLKNYNVEYSKYYEEFEPEMLGTLVNSPGETSCLVSTELGTSQLMDIKKDRIFFIPVEKGASARLVIKSQELGSVEKTVRGGKLGVIIDTRSKHEIETYDYNSLQMDINNNLKNIHEVLTKL
ncbi:hypothetical protein ACFLZK_01435 [Patescibacteria group bacterium]